MTADTLISFLNVATIAFGILAILFGIAAAIIAFLCKPFRKPEAESDISHIIEKPKKQIVVAVTTHEEQVTMQQLFEIPSYDYAGWLGSIQREERILP